MTSSSSSVPIARSGWTYDVFLSFRGVDTRNTFVDHLYAALVQKGIHTFKDNVMLGGGEQISSALLNAIQESRFAVVVLSKNYANSSWCLEELAKIMECHHQMGQKVLPVFYHVDPSDVRGRKRDFETAFKQHEEGKFKGEMDKVNKWREALTTAANLSGHHISAFSGGEAAIVNMIVEKISADNPARRRENNLIGIESHMKKLISKLNLESGEVRTIGILGMGGIGKTTIARVLFRRISYKFVGSSFVKDVRENSSTPKDICALQEKILTDILGAHHGSIIQDPENGADKIQERLGNKKVLLVLDDVDDFKQLEFLAESNEWFGSGSRIIITTRNEQLLSDANTKYKPALLTKDQALELFSRHAFRGSNPPDGYKDLSDRAIHYTGRLPLALKVLGSFFRGRQASVWESALDKLPKIPSREIFDTLKLSFDYLDDDEKQIFLDIACFFKGQKVEDVTRVLDSFGFHTKIGISVLVEKSLITVSNKTLGMHDLIQEMGRKIVSESFPSSRLWLVDVIHDLIKKSRELHAIEAIVVPRIDPDQGLPVDVFENMKNLRLLDVYDKFTCGEPTSLPDELRWFCWSDYPFASLPVADMRKLVGLELRFSRINYLWNGHKSMLNLRIINLEYSDSLIRFPDVSGAPNVESLSLSGCENLEEVDGSLGYLRRLSYLNMSHCLNLKCLPSRLEMESLETLILSYCDSLERFPELSPCMVKLYELDLSNCSKIEELPSSIEYLCNLRFLNLSCTNLVYIPHSICELKCLTSLNLAGCFKLQNLPDEFGRMEKLQELHLKLPASVSFHVLNTLCSLRKLDLSGSQIPDKDFPEDLNGFFLLEELSLCGNHSLLELPASITNLTHLKNLNISKCWELQIAHRLPSGIQVLNASNCISLRKIENLSEGYEWLNNISLYDCKRLLEDAESERYLDKMLKETFLTKYVAVDSCVSIGVPGNMIPSWFKEQHDGDKIALKLPPNWQTQIMGFAISVVFSSKRHHEIDFLVIKIRFEDDGMLVTKADMDCINACSGSENGNLWVGYVPFSLFEQLNDHGEDWSHVFGGNLVIDIYYGNQILRCGAKVVYKEEVESTQQTKPSIPPFYWNWKLSQYSPNTFICKLSQYFPNTFVENLQELHLKLPANVRKLNLSDCNIRDFPEDLNGFSLLEELLLRDNRLLELPASITHLTRLKNLDITGCMELQIVHGLPSGIQVLNASNCRSLRKIENLSEGYEWLNYMSLYDCKRLLEDAESERYLDKMLKETFLTKYVAVDSCASICVPGNMIPSWFKEQEDGDEIALKLPPNWQTQIMGFAISVVFSSERHYDIDFLGIRIRFEDDGMLVTKADMDCINACSGSENGNLWVGYVPFSLFTKADWSHVFGGNLLIDIYYGNQILRCGAKVVYKEEVESTQQTKPSIPPFYWNWKLSQTSPNTFECKNNLL